jgi:hypothetical protein
MALTTSSSVQEQEIDSAVHRVESKFAQDVHHIRYSFEENWIGAPSVLFRIVVRDEASRGDHQLYELSNKVSISLLNEAKTDENGLYAYFDFRSMSEQAKLKDPAWA